MIDGQSTLAGGLRVTTRPSNDLQSLTAKTPTIRTMPSLMAVGGRKNCCSAGIEHHADIARCRAVVQEMVAGKSADRQPADIHAFIAAEQHPDE